MVDARPNRTPAEWKAIETEKRYNTLRNYALALATLTHNGEPIDLVYLNRLAFKMFLAAEGCWEELEAFERKERGHQNV